VFEQETSSRRAVTDFQPVIGLEIHVQLATRTKMFCGCEVSFGAEPNVYTCPICLGHPGVLPVTNERAVRYGLEIALALDCEIAPRSIFHRKNYFYPDIPKGYQITQYEIPLAAAGELAGVRIHRVHLEEDTAKMIHVGESGRIHGSSTSIVDFNRSGTPLVEIVTEPDLRGAAEAREWAQLLRATIKRIGASDVNMEEGSLRVDANVSVRPAGQSELGTKTELKNMNSFRFLERGIAAEVERQTGLLEAGEPVVQETLHYNPRDGSLTPLRSKEYAHDYRYFPEPDLVPLAPSAATIEELRAGLPELPAERRERYLKLGVDDAMATQLAFDSDLGDYFEAALAAAAGAEARGVASWVTGELVARLREAGDGAAAPSSSRVSPESLGALIAMRERGEVTSGGARQVLAVMVGEGGEPAAIAEREGLFGTSGAEELDAIVERAIAANPGAVDQLRAGKQQAIGPIVGAVMREARGRADGAEVRGLILARLGIES
jgi:aspartyl-tRNA(Asn)/glutamyl-tRNA(Gln) amidotransferase subunit B